MKHPPSWLLVITAGVSVAGVAVLLLAGLAVADYLRIGSIPSPCTSEASSESAAVILSGGPHFRRTRRAVALYHDGLVQKLVFSGAGNGGDSAELLAREAQRLGVADGALIVENRARSTYQNLRYSCALAALNSTDRLAVVTDQFHSYRAWATARTQCPDVALCSVPVPMPTSHDRRLSESRKLFAYQLLGRAAWW